MFKLMKRFIREEEGQDFAFYLPEQMEAWLKEAGFDLMETLVHEPNPNVEVATRRAYLFARKLAL